jgi:hypothetical protein
VYSTNAPAKPSSTEIVGLVGVVQIGIVLPATVTTIEVFTVATVTFTKSNVFALDGVELMSASTD